MRPSAADRQPAGAAAHWFINGKFTAQRLTGVQRAAGQLVRALDDKMPGLPQRCTLLCPPGACPPTLRHIEVRTVGRAWPSLHLWEQWSLPRAARAGRLLNLAGSAPWFARRQACMLHDAAPFDQPRAYTRVFGLWYRALFRRLAVRADALLTVSAFSRRRLAACLGIAPERIAVVPHGSEHLDGVRADAQALARLGLAGRRYLLAVGSDNPTKNLPRLVQAFARLQPGPAVALVIVGGRNRRVFAARSTLPDPPDVMRVGPVDDAALKALYQGAVALVFPSLYEGFGLPPLEAMACGCPVVAARAVAVAEVCGAAALYVDAAVVDEIAAAMRCLRDDEAARRRLIAAGRERAARYSWPRAAEALVSALAA